MSAEPIKKCQRSTESSTTAADQEQSAVDPPSLLFLDDDAFDIVREGVERHVSGLAALACTCGSFRDMLQPRLTQLRRQAEDSLCTRLQTSQEALAARQQADWRGAQLTVTDSRIIRGWLQPGGLLVDLQSIVLSVSVSPSALGLSLRAARVLAPALASLPHLQSIILDRRQFNVARDFRGAEGPSELTVPSNVLDATFFAALAAVAPRLSKLRLESNSMKRLNARELSGRKRIESLDLSMCMHGHGAGIVIAALVAANRCLRTLDLSHNFIEQGVGHEAVGVALADCLLSNSTLTSLRLQWCGIGPSAPAFGRALAANCSLTYLDLRENGIDSRGGRMLASGLVRNSTLTKLRLSGNRFPLDGRAAHALRQAAASSSSSIRRRVALSL